MKNNILKVVGLIALFFSLSSLSITKIIPEVINISQPVDIALRAYSLLGSVSLFYLLLILFKNNGLWFNQLNNRKFVEWNKLLLFPIIFIAYFVFHVFMILTENISNGNFEWTYISLNLNLMVERYVPLTLLIIVGILLLEKIADKKGKKSWRILEWVPTLKREDIFVSLLSFLAFSDYLLRDLIWKTSFGPHNSRGVYQLQYASEKILARQDFMRLVGAYLFIFIVVFTLSYLVFKGVSAFYKKQKNFALVFVSSLFLAIIFNYFIQVSIKSDTFVTFHGTIATGATAFQVFVLTLLFILAYLLINRYLAATALNIVAASLFSFANGIKFSERQEPIYVSELSWLSNPQTLLSFVDVKSIVLVIGLGVVVTLAVIFLSRKFFPGKLLTWKTRGLTLMALVLVYLPISQNFKTFTKPANQVKVPILTRYMNVSNGDILWKGSTHTARTKSLSYLWLRQIYGTAMEEPLGYSEEKVKEIADKYSKLAADINTQREQEINEQTVIYILSESLANPNRVNGITLSENPLQNIDQLKNSASGGLMYADGYGGGTANMEAQTLTGLPKVNYSSDVSIINSDVLPNMPFIPSISDHFTNKIALHPENAANYNRNKVYKKLDFDHFYALSNTKDGDILKNQKRLDGVVSDAQVYEDVLSKINPEESQFFSVLTMQNHMPYTRYGGTSQITATVAGYSPTSNNLLQNYVRKINESDLATQEFIQKLEKIDKKITVVFYGDHLPNIYPNPSKNFADDVRKQYQTDYFIWSNRGNKNDKQEDLNSAEFIPALFEATGSKVSPYYALLSEVMWSLPAEYNSSLSTQVDLNEEQKKLAEDLKIIQYDLTSGKHYLEESSSFFQIQ